MKCLIFIYLVIIMLLLNYISFKNIPYIPKLGMAYIKKIDYFKYINKNQSLFEYKTAILSSFINYDSNKLISFIKCLEYVKFKGHIILFTNKNVNHNISNLLIHKIIINNIYPYYSLDNIEFPIDLNILHNTIPKKCRFNIRRYYL